MIAHTFAFHGHNDALKDQAAGMKHPCYVFGYPVEYVRAYCLAYGYDASGRKLRPA